MLNSLTHDENDGERADLDSEEPKQITRPVITSHEGILLETLSNTVKAVEGKFWCGGSARVDVENPVIVYPVSSTDGGHVWKHVNLGMLVDGFAELHEAANPSSHGVGNRTVYDESYRLARELRVGEFALNFDPIGHDTGIVEAVTAICGSAIRLQLYKMNSYAEGGFFRAHKDTPKSENHIGSIVLALPTPYKGGELVIQHEDRKVAFDWGASMDARSLQWAFFFSDVTHEILPVTKGHRVTLAYDVYKADEMTSSSLAIDLSTTPLFDVFSRTLADPAFLIEGGRVTFGLKHQYPVKDNSSADRYFALLKGSDRLLYEVLASLKLEAKLLAVYRLSAADVSEDDFDAIPQDKFTSWWWHDQCDNVDAEGEDDDLLTAQLEESLVLLVSNKFKGITGDMDGGDLYMELQTHSNADVDNSLIWCSRPAGTWTPLSHYIGTYGNEPAVACSYAAAALVVTIPAVSQRQRS